MQNLFEWYVIYKYRHFLSHIVESKFKQNMKDKNSAMVEVVIFILKKKM